MPNPPASPRMPDGQLFQALPANLPEEIFTTLLSTPHLKIERIVSKGHCSPAGFWYEQEQSEWVLLLQGEAQLEFAEPGMQLMHLLPGDYINIPMRQKHRVAWTTPAVETVWLAIFY